MNDIYKAYENILLHFDGSNGSTTITDDAGHTITVSGNAQISTAQSKFNGSSCYFNGSSGTYLTLPSTKDLNFGTDDLTIEGWIYPVGGGSPLINSQNSTNLLNFLLDSSTSGRLLLNGSDAITGIALQANTWQHIAITKIGIVWRVFVNGVLSGSPFTMSANYTFDCSANTYIGGYNGGHYFNGYVDEFRLIKGYCFYTQPFSVPTSPYVYRNNTSFFMKFDGTNGANTIGAFIEETGKSVSSLYGSPTLSSTQVKNGTTSCYFNGGSGVLMTANSAFSFGSGNFTIEFWVWTDPSTGAWTRTLENEQYNVTGGWHFSYNGSDSVGQRRLGFQLGLNGGGGARLESNSAIPTGQWIHIAVVRDGTTISMFVNGVKQTATITSSENFTSTKLMMGVALDYSNPFTGYIDSPILLKGVARYSSNFDPSLVDYFSPNVIFLCHCDGSNNSTTFIDEIGNAIVANGNAVQSTTQSQFGGSSGYLDGIGDYLQLASSLLSNQSYAIECWIYPTAYSSDASWGRYIYSQYENGVDFGNRFILGFPENNNHKLQSFHASGGGSLLSTSDIALNAWTHIATTYDGSTRRLFVNGIMEASVATSGASLSSASSRIGCVSYGSMVGFYQGYIDELRITRGAPRYIANFNVPFDAFVYGQTSRAYLIYLNDLLTCAPNAIAGSYIGKYIPEIFTSSPSYYDGGTFSITGNLTYNNSPASRKVSLFTLKDKRLIAETWSDPATGAYSFDRLKDQEYFVWADDYLRVFTPVTQEIADQSNLAFSVQTRFDPQLFEGNGSIWGTVLDASNQPLSKRLLLLDDQTYIIVKTVQSDAVTGYYEFTGLNTSRVFTVVCEDDRPIGPYNDIIRSKVLAV